MWDKYRWASGEAYNTMFFLALLKGPPLDSLASLALKKHQDPNKYYAMRSLGTYLTDTINGNSSAFNEVVIRFQSWALRHANSVLQDRALAEDAVQEAFLTAYQNLGSLRNLDLFPKWFRTILRSSISRTIRRHDLNIPFVELDEAKDLAEVAPHDLETLEKNQLKGMVRQAIRSLPPKTREACTYFYVDGYSQKEIAEFLDIPVGTIKRRLHDARIKIRDYLKTDQQTQIIRVGYLPISDHLLAMVSHQLNSGDNELQIHLKKFLSWSSLIKAVSSHTIDVAFLMAPMAMALKNQGFPIAYVLDANRGGSAITVRKSIQSKKQLSGSLLGLPGADSTHWALLHQLMHNESLSFEKDKAPVFLNPSYSINALRTGKIDGFFCAEPWNTKAVREGAGHILVRSNHILEDHICCIVTVNQNFASRAGQTVRLYMKRLMEAQELALSDPTKCSLIQARYTGIDPEIAEEVIRKSHITFSDMIPDRARIHETMNLALAAGSLKAECDLDSFISLEFH